MKENGNHKWKGFKDLGANDKLTTDGKDSIWTGEDVPFSGSTAGNRKKISKMKWSKGTSIKDQPKAREGREAMFGRDHREQASSRSPS